MKSIRLAMALLGVLSAISPDKPARAQGQGELPTVTLREANDTQDTLALGRSNGRWSVRFILRRSKPLAVRGACNVTADPSIVVQIGSFKEFTPATITLSAPSATPPSGTVYLTCPDRSASATILLTSGNSDGVPRRLSTIEGRLAAFNDSLRTLRSETERLGSTLRSLVRWVKLIAGALLLLAPAVLLLLSVMVLSRIKGQHRVLGAVKAMVAHVRGAARQFPLEPSKPDSHPDPAKPEFHLAIEHGTGSKTLSHLPDGSDSQSGEQDLPPVLSSGSLETEDSARVDHSSTAEAITPAQSQPEAPDRHAPSDGPIAPMDAPLQPVAEQPLVEPGVDTLAAAEGMAERSPVSIDSSGRSSAGAATHEAQDPSVVAAPMQEGTDTRSSAQPLPQDTVVAASREDEVPDEVPTKQPDGRIVDSDSAQPTPATQDAAAKVPEAPIDRADATQGGTGAAAAEETGAIAGAAAKAGSAAEQSERSAVASAGTKSKPDWYEQFEAARMRLKEPASRGRVASAIQRALPIYDALVEIGRAVDEKLATENRRNPLLRRASFERAWLSWLGTALDDSHFPMPFTMNEQVRDPETMQVRIKEQMAQAITVLENPEELVRRAEELLVSELTLESVKLINPRRGEQKEGVPGWIKTLQKIGPDVEERHAPSGTVQWPYHQKLTESSQGSSIKRQIAPGYMYKREMVVPVLISTEHASATVSLPDPSK